MPERYVKKINLPKGQRAERKLLVTIAEWEENGTIEREILGTRTTDSSIDYNVDMETTTDILGNNYTDMNKTQPQQDFDPHLVLGGDKLTAKLNDIRKRNALAELQQFTLYIVTLFTGKEGAYDAERHTDCTIAYSSIGGDVNVNFPISVYFSNKITLGTIDKIAPDFVFTEGEVPDDNSSSGGGGSTPTTPVTYTVTQDLTNVTSSFAGTSVEEGAAFTTTLTADSGYTIDDIEVTMGGTNITSTAVSGDTITISNVTGNIMITATAI